MVSARAGRLMRAGSVLGASHVGTILVQLITVPVLLLTWQPVLYGEWLLLSTVPAFFWLAQLGLTSVAHNRIDAACAGGDFAAANRTFLASLVILPIAMAAAVLVIVLVTFGFNEALSSMFAVTGAGERQVTFGLLVADGILAVLFTHVASLLRSVQRVAEMASWEAAARLGGAAIVPVVALAGGGLGAAALAVVVFHIAIQAALVVRLRRVLGWLDLRAVRLDRAEAAMLGRLMATFALLPASAVIYLQGSVLLVGALLGPAAVALFGSMRAFTRLIVQVVPILGTAMWPEFAHAEAKGDGAGTQRMVRFLLVSAPATTAALAVAYALVGEPFFQLWTQSRFAFDHTLFFWLIAQAVILALVATLEVPILAVNRHSRYAVLALLATLFGLLLGWLLVPSLGLAGVAAGGVVAGLVPLFYTVVSARRVIGDDG